MPAFGCTTVLGVRGGSAGNYLVGVKYVAPEEGDITSVSYYCQSKLGLTIRMKIKVYSDENGEARSLLVESSELLVDGTWGWRSFPLILHINAGVPYWFVVFSDLGWNWMEDAGEPDQSFYQDSSHQTYPLNPELITSPHYGAFRISLYAEYTPTVAPPSIRVWSRAGENLVARNEPYTIELSDFPPNSDVGIALFTSIGDYLLSRTYRTNMEGYVLDETLIWHGQPYGTEWYWEWNADPSIRSPAFTEVIPQHLLSISNTIIGIELIIRDSGGGEMSYVTPWSGLKDEDVYDIIMPSNLIVDDDTFNFANWRDDLGNVISTNPILTINLVADASVFYSYELVAVTAIQVHAFYMGEEVNAQGRIVETGQTFTTPDTIDVLPGPYTVEVTYLDITQSYSVDVAEQQTVRVDAQLVAPKPPLREILAKISPLLVGVGMIIASKE